MHYSKLTEVYENLEQTPSRLKKTEILANLLKKLKVEKNKEIIYLLQGKVYPDYIEKEFGISEQLCIKAISRASGESTNEIIQKWKKIGDLGEVARDIMKKKKQNTLFSSKLTTEKVITNLRKLPELTGKGTVDRKLAIISELLTSASEKEAKYIIRTLLNELRIGVASGTIRDSIVEACLEKTPENTKAVQDAYDKSTDFLLVFKKACTNIKALNSITITPGHPIKVMLALKAENIEDGFKRVGKPAALEYKYDGFRMLINKNQEEIKIFTRRLDEVTKQFPDVIKYIKENIKAKSFIIDCEAVGYDPKTKKYMPFEAVSQRIRRKHHIEELVKKLPIEINAFDIIYYNGKTLLEEPFEKRSEILRKIIKNKKYHLKTSEQIITSDEKKADEFYKKALKDNQEGIMIKNLKSEYRPGVLPCSDFIKGIIFLVNSEKDNPSSSFSFNPVEAFPISKKFPLSIQDNVNEDKNPTLFPFPYSADVITRSNSFSEGLSFNMCPTLPPGLYSDLRFFIIIPSWLSFNAFL